MKFTTQPLWDPFKICFPPGAQQVALTVALTSALEAFSFSLSVSTMVLRGSAGDKEDPSQTHGFPRLTWNFPLQLLRETAPSTTARSLKASPISGPCAEQAFRGSHLTEPGGPLQMTEVCGSHWANCPCHLPQLQIHPTPQEENSALIHAFQQLGPRTLFSHHSQT